VGWRVESSPLSLKHGVQGFNGRHRWVSFRLVTFKTSFPTWNVFSPLLLLRDRSPDFFLLLFKTHTIGMDQSTLDISHVEWHHLPMAYKYTPLPGVGLCCRDKQDAVIQRWVTQRREKEHCTNPRFPSSTCYHVGGWKLATMALQWSEASRTGNTQSLDSPFTCEGLENNSCVQWSWGFRSRVRQTGQTSRGISETSSLKSHGCLLPSAEAGLVWHKRLK